MNCSGCNDLGVIKVTSHSDGIDTLMLCNCLEGVNQRYALPRWEWKYGQLFKREVCPLEWFKPDMVVMAPSGHMKLRETIDHKIRYWRAKVNIAEGYWEQAKRESEGA